MESDKKTTDKRYVKSKVAIENAIEKIYETGKALSTISVSDITKFADITRKTFYLHYKDLNDFVKQFINENVDKLMTKYLHQKPNVSVSTAVLDVFTSCTKHIYENKFLQTIIATAPFNVTFFTTLKDKMKAFFSHYLKDEKATPEYILEFFASGIVSAYQLWLSKNDSFVYDPSFDNEIKNFVKTALTPYINIENI